ncbi:hypothetical protein [Bacteroides caecimuris]|uniref:hypothetical protein n=1 Tax=Bacteroides caecimuris TaxID=1796613 RepID=UPI002573B7AF|nr:hypothetical protein [Bacteroides caecimuris]
MLDKYYEMEKILEDENLMEKEERKKKCNILEVFRGIPLKTSNILFIFVPITLKLSAYD